MQRRWLASGHQDEAGCVARPRNEDGGDDLAVYDDPQLATLWGRARGKQGGAELGAQRGDGGRLLRCGGWNDAERGASQGKYREDPLHVVSRVL